MKGCIVVRNGRQLSRSFLALKISGGNVNESLEVWVLAVMRQYSLVEEF